MLNDGTVLEKEKTEQEKSLDNVKNTVKLIEGVFHAINAASFPLRFNDIMLQGMSFLDKMHTELINQIPKDEIEKIKLEQNAQNSVDKSVVGSSREHVN